MNEYDVSPWCWKSIDLIREPSRRVRSNGALMQMLMSVLRWFTVQITWSLNVTTTLLPAEVEATAATAWGKRGWKGGSRWVVQTAQLHLEEETKKLSKLLTFHSSDNFSGLVMCSSRYSCTPCTPACWTRQQICTSAQQWAIWTKNSTTYNRGYANQCIRASDPGPVTPGQWPRASDLGPVTPGLLPRASHPGPVNPGQLPQSCAGTIQSYGDIIMCGYNSISLLCTCTQNAMATAPIVLEMLSKRVLSTQWREVL